ncbi:MAG: hypothetical protein V1925_02890 [Candidatus Omnitrophota bacterium]
MNSSGYEIDAIIEGSGLKSALEHTSIDTIPQQREDSARFMKVIGCLEKELDGEFPGDIRLLVNCYIIQPGKNHNWDDYKNRLYNWLINNVALLSSTDKHITYNISGIPFSISLCKRNSTVSSFKVGRIPPEDKTLLERIMNLLTCIEIKNKFSKYRKQNFRILLLIENNDIALMNSPRMVDSIRKELEKNYELPIDEVWHVNSSILSSLRYYEVFYQ